MSAAATLVADHVPATVHPSSILRADEDRRELEYRSFVDDLKKVAKLV